MARKCLYALFTVEESCQAYTFDMPLNMHKNLPLAVRSAIQDSKLVSDESPSIDIFDLDHLEARIKDLNEAFSEDFILNAYAMKVNPIRGVLRSVLTGGLGVECASLPEAKHALQMGFPPQKIIYGGLCKTKSDLEFTISAGMMVNLDNDQELRVVDQILKKNKESGLKGKFGLRVNPVVGAGENAQTSTATRYSKFGVPITEENDFSWKTAELFATYPWLSGLHMHVGSQGIPMEKLVKAAQTAFEFAQKVESLRPGQLKLINIGGGLSTCYEKAEEPEEFSYKVYKEQLFAAVPGLFSGKYELVTEFGRSLCAKAGSTLTRIEYIKQWFPDVPPMLMTHVGANQFPWETYFGSKWTHRLSVVQQETGRVLPTADDSNGNRETYCVAGPLCFQGDFIEKTGVSLPKAEPGDILLIHDTGSYAMAMYSRFHSFTPSQVWGYRLTGKSVEWVSLKDRETAEETLAFWGN